MKKTADKILIENAKLFHQKSKEYGNAYQTFGKFAQSLFPEGITLKTEHDFAKYSTLHMVLVKIHRYAQNFHKGHRDSLNDLCVYAAMLTEIDTVDDQFEQGISLCELKACNKDFDTHNSYCQQCMEQAQLGE